jgi:hypothetical protein
MFPAVVGFFFGSADANRILFFLDGKDRGREIFLAASTCCVGG